MSLESEKDNQLLEQKGDGCQSSSVIGSWRGRASGHKFLFYNLINEFKMISPLPCLAIGGGDGRRDDLFPVQPDRTD